MAETIDELTVSYTDGGVETVKELDKQVLTKGAWTTIIFKFQNWDPKEETYGPDKYTIRRYQKSGGVYKLRSKFNISNNKQAQQIIDVLSQWIDESSNE